MFQPALDGQVLTPDTIVLISKWLHAVSCLEVNNLDRAEELEDHPFVFAGEMDRADLRESYPGAFTVFLEETKGDDGSILVYHTGADSIVIVAVFVYTGQRRIVAQSSEASTWFDYAW
jgi:hypothetical protein